ncbi:MAG: protein kinase [Minicystis sp.]
MPLFQRGTHFAGHVIVRLLGTGRIAEVYEVVAPDGRLRALKVFKLDAPLSAKAQARLGQEGEAVATIEHVNVVRFFDAGVEQGRVWILLELVEGPDLRRLVEDAGGALPIERAVRIVRQACEGVTAAHRLGILHRDLSPENILVAADDVAKVADFGSAKLRGVRCEDDGRAGCRLVALHGARVHDEPRRRALQRRVLDGARALRDHRRRAPDRAAHGDCAGDLPAPARPRAASARRARARCARGSIGSGGAGDGEGSGAPQRDVRDGGGARDRAPAVECPATRGGAQLAAAEPREAPGADGADGARARGWWDDRRGRSSSDGGVQQPSKEPGRAGERFIGDAIDPQRTGRVERRRTAIELRSSPRRSGP